jgi:hypothetical protein
MQQQQQIQEIYFAIGGMLLVSITILALFIVMIGIGNKQTSILIRAIEYMQSQLTTTINSFYRLNSSIDLLSETTTVISRESGKYLDSIHEGVESLRNQHLYKSKSAKLKFKKMVVESEVVPYPQKIPMLVIIDDNGNEQDYVIYDGLVYLLENNISIDKQELHDILNEFKTWMSSLD